MVLFALAFVFGAFCLQQMPVLPHLYWALLGVPFGLISIKLQHHRSAMLQFSILQLIQPVLIAVIGVFAGLFWAALFAIIRLDVSLPHQWENKPIELIGVVASVSEMTERGERFRFNVEQVLTNGVNVPEHIFLSYYTSDTRPEASVSEVARQAKFMAGERWQLTARLKRPNGVQNPHGFDFESWAIAENVRAVGNIRSKPQPQKLNDFVWSPKYIVERTRDVIKQQIASVLNGKAYGSVIQALVMGDDSQISVQDWQLFLRTGITHLISISGLHITMLSGLAFSVVGFAWRRLPKLATAVPTRKAAILAGMVTALIYALIAGFSVPTQRTLYMLMVFGLALWSGRLIVISQVLALALLVVVILDPWAVTAAGFWLSFGAVAILSFALGGRIGPVHWLAAAIKTQWAVTLGMLPLLLIMFHQASVISPIANAIAIPVISLLVTPLALLGSFLHLDIALYLSHELLALCVRFLRWLDALPVSVWQQPSPAIWTLIPAMLGVAWALMPKGMPLRWLGFAGIFPMLLLTPASPASGSMKVTVLDVGQGLSVVVQTRHHVLLYDAGAKFNAESDAGSRIVVPFLQGEGIKKLDGFIVSHNDNDHSGGMVSVAALMPVDWFASSLPDSQELMTDAERMRCYAGQAWRWDGVDFEMLYPNWDDYEDARLSDNNRSCVLKITSAGGSILLTGDIERFVESSLVSDYADVMGNRLKSDILIAPHHGSKTSSSVEFLEAVHPAAGIFTAGYLNRFRHPRPEVLLRYARNGSLIFRSDYHGALTLDFSGKRSDKKIEISSWRQQHRRYWHDIYD